jgi:hypothetical protein
VLPAIFPLSGESLILELGELFRHPLKSHPRAPRLAVAA